MSSKPDRKSWPPPPGFDDWRPTGFETWASPDNMVALTRGLDQRERQFLYRFRESLSASRWPAKSSGWMPIDEAVAWHIAYLLTGEFDEGAGKK